MNSDENGTASASSTESIAEETITLTSTPNDGYKFKEWIVVTGDVTLDDSESATTSFTMPEKDVEVTATYEENKLVQSVAINGPSKIKMGANASYSGEITPSDATTKVLKWTVENKTGSATINSNTGELTPTSAGTVTVKAKATDGSGVEAILEVTIENIVTPPTPPTPDKPTITAGAGSTHQINNGKDITFTCSGKLEDLTGIYVDENLVAKSNYTLQSGSTILTLNASYLDTLSTGKHTLKFQYKDNISAETDFTITAKASETPVKASSPKTGDSSNVMIYLGLIVLSGCVTIFGLKKKRASNK